MKEEKIFESIADIDEKYIAEARTKTAKKMRPVWIKWTAIAACLCLIVASVVGVPRFKKTNSSDTLEHRISDFGIGSKTIVDPVFIAQNEMPKRSPKDLLNSIKNNVTVQGTLSSMDTVRIKDNDSVWFITTAVISVDEVITGKYDSDKVHIVCAACYTGVPVDENTVPITCLIGCQENADGVFVLRGLDDGTWTISGKEILPKSLGDYYIVYYLERSGDVLTFIPQNISVSVNDIVR
ncbi:MAG: hypothetical protein ACOX17_09535 [Christensenellales bacterium]|jgi:hypothetical protein